MGWNRDHGAAGDVGQDTVAVAAGSGGSVRGAPVVIVGAGAAGLAAGAMLHERGIDSLILERGGHVGESWRHRYDGLRLNSVRWMSSLPGYLMERRYGDFPGRDAWADYLERYAVRHQLEIEQGVEVHRIARAGGGWRLATSRGKREARFVVVASGMDHTPTVPDWPGREAFQGRLLHSAEYRSPEPFKGSDILVVGAGNSATEIAHGLAHRGARRVWISVRTAPLILPRRVLGISITAWAIPLAPLRGRLPDRVMDGLSRATQRLSFGDLTPYGLPPSPRGISAQWREGYVAPVDSGFVAAVKRGSIEVVGALERFEDAEVVIAGGRRLRPAAVIAATGYRTGLRPLVGHLGVLADDERPRAYGGAEPPGTPGLFFTGYHYALFPTLPHLRAEARGIAEAIVSTL